MENKEVKMTDLSKLRDELALDYMTNHGTLPVEHADEGERQSFMVGWDACLTALAAQSGEFAWASDELERAAKEDEKTCGIMPHSLDSVQWQKFCSFKHGAKFQFQQDKATKAAFKAELTEKDRRIAELEAALKMYSSEVMRIGATISPRHADKALQRGGKCE